MPDTYTTRDAVRNLQRYLRRLSYEENAILPVPVDGIFDSQTEEALSEFQRMIGVPATGIADRETWDALFAEYSRLLREQDLRVPIDFFPSIPEDYETVPEEHHAFITLLQFMLGELTLVYDAYPPPALTGIYNRETEQALQAFQSIHGLPSTGRLNRNTWNRLSEEYRNYLT